MKKEIESALDVLVGKHLWDSGRAADLQWFQFGPRRTVADVKGRTKEVGEYALHVQCAWRIRKGDSVIVGSRDLYSPAQKVDGDPNFDWQVLGASKRDRRILELFENGAREYLVSSVDVWDAGSFSVVLQHEYTVDIFPDDSSSEEYWRLLKPYADAPHCIVSNTDIKQE